MCRRVSAFVLGLVILLLGGSIASSAAPGSPVVARFELNRLEDFVDFGEFGIAPFFRQGNVFLAEVDRNLLRAAQDAGIPCSVIDDQPFSARYYLGPTESLLSRRIPGPDLESITDIGGQTIYRTLSPINAADYRRLGFEPYEIKRRAIPLTHFPDGPAAINPRVGEPDPVLEALLAAVNQDTLYAYNTRLEDFQTRLSLTDSNIAARDWLKNRFESMGYTDVSLDEFWCLTNRHGRFGYTNNVVCIKPGTAEPDKVLVIGGHFDSVVYGASDPYIFAPGSDDNGSGTAAVLEIARVLAQEPTNKTIVFIAFAAEESGLEGSAHYAAEAYAAGMDIELMINMDMIGYTNDDYPDVTCAQYPPYRYLMGRLAEEYTWLYPDTQCCNSNSDHTSFHQYGYNCLLAHESDFNHIGWHTPQDLTARMDFPYMTEVVKMCLATLYTVDRYPAPINDAVARDMGDGQTLQVEWTASSATNLAGYWVYWGTVSETYTDSSYFPGGGISQVSVGDLVELQPYYLTVDAVDTESRKSILHYEITGVPRSIPLPPAGLARQPGATEIVLSWDPNLEIDFSHYNIYRGTEPGVYSLLAGNWTDTEYTDTDIIPDTEYEYVITAVDTEAQESEYSAPVLAFAADFDGGILLIDATPDGPGNPSPAARQAFYNSVFDGLPVTYQAYDPDGDSLTKSMLGQYRAICWFDDGHAGRLWKEDDLDKLRWYLSYDIDVLMAGWRLAYAFADFTVPHTFVEGDFLHDFALINTVEQLTEPDVIGVEGRQEYPDMDLDPDKIPPEYDGKMPNIGTLVSDGGDVIYRVETSSGQNESKNVGVRLDNGMSKFLLMSMPFYYLDDYDARISILHTMWWFGMEAPCECSHQGDLNNDSNINPVDVVFLVNYVYKSIPFDWPTYPLCYQGELALSADWNCDGAVNPLDAVLMVNHVYKAIGEPCNPCGCDPYPDGCP